MGFGHRVYRQGDPRAKHLREMSKQLTELTGEENGIICLSELKKHSRQKKTCRQT